MDIENSLRYKFNYMIIPHNLAGNNCREYLTISTWNRIKYLIHRIDKNTCQCCGRKGLRLQAHEEFKIDMEKGIYFLEGIYSICEMCHKCVHIKMSRHKNDLKERLEHINNFKLIESKRKAKKEIRRNIKETNNHNWEQCFNESYRVKLDYCIEFCIKNKIPIYTQINPEYFFRVLSSKFHDKKLISKAEKKKGVYLKL